MERGTDMREEAKSSLILALSRQSSPDDIRRASSESTKKKKKEMNTNPPPLRIHYPKYTLDKSEQARRGIEVPIPLSPGPTLFPPPPSEVGNVGPYLDRMAGTHEPLDFKDTKG
jgi:hypothetical protein